MHLGATFLVFILLVALLGPMLLQVNNILWEMGFSSLTEHCPWSSFHLANVCSGGWTKGRKLNLFLAVLLKIELFPSEGRRKPSCTPALLTMSEPSGQLDWLELECCLKRAGGKFSFMVLFSVCIW